MIELPADSIAGRISSPPDNFVCFQPFQGAVGGIGRDPRRGRQLDRGLRRGLVGRLARAIDEWQQQLEHGAVGQTRDTSRSLDRTGNKRRFQPAEAPGPCVCRRGQPMQRSQAAEHDLQLLRQDLPARFQIVDKMIAQRGPAAFRVGDDRRLVGRPVGHAVDDRPHQAFFQPRQIEWLNIRKKAEGFQPLSRVIAAGDEHADCVALQALTHHAPEGVLPRCRFRGAPNARLRRQEALAMPWLRLVVVELIEQQQRTALRAPVIIGKYFRILPGRGTRFELGARRIVGRYRSGKAFANRAKRAVLPIENRHIDVDRQKSLGKGRACCHAGAQQGRFAAARTR